MGIWVNAPGVLVLTRMVAWGVQVRRRWCGPRRRTSGGRPCDSPPYRLVQEASIATPRRAASCLICEPGLAVCVWQSAQATGAEISLDPSKLQREGYNLVYRLGGLPNCWQVG